MGERVCAPIARVIDGPTGLREAKVVAYPPAVPFNANINLKRQNNNNNKNRRPCTRYIGLGSRVAVTGTRILIQWTRIFSCCFLVYSVRLATTMAISFWRGIATNQESIDYDDDDKCVDVRRLTFWSPRQTYAKNESLIDWRTITSMENT